ncbi:Box C/D snoRNA accumulation [Spiromyces aspiralis]|uniref:Box C/D snoRNA accumulation n=1 Tax=Spiromyces aspiralis TaxID=68401 RepID=A0ACC1HGM6_9FUNG|nr:Box C/D snoRNA accumulation [Spiromyces aspiralis]
MQVDQPAETQPKRRPMCQQCNCAEFKYKCPACEARTCSLACSKQHKQKTGCTGIRDKTKFVPRKEYDENTMMSDYTFLQDMSREQTNTKRDRTKAERRIKGGIVKYRHMTRMAKARRKVGIITMSPGLKRHDSNRTNWNAKRGCLFFTLDLIWVLDREGRDGGPQVIKLVDHGFPDEFGLHSLLDVYTATSSGPGDDTGKPAPKVRIVSPTGQEFNFGSHASRHEVETLRELLLPHMESDSEGAAKRLVWLLKVPIMSGKMPTYRRVDPGMPLHTQLANQSVLEYPTIYVYSRMPEVSLDGYPVTILPPITEDPAYQVVDLQQRKQLHMQESAHKDRETSGNNGGDEDYVECCENEKRHRPPIARLEDNPEDSKCDDTAAPPS